MDMVGRLKLRTGEGDEALLSDLIETAKHAILSRRFPFGTWPTREITVESEDGGTEVVEETYVEPRYEDLQFRIALDLYNKIGAEGETSHSENGISRSYESSWISEQLLAEVTPFAGVPQ